MNLQLASILPTRQKVDKRLSIQQLEQDIPFQPTRLRLFLLNSIGIDVLYHLLHKSLLRQSLDNPLLGQNLA
jgi:hypothetical protein